ncbi:MAG TPA: hypothetical protein VFJ20_06485 [Gemmatimonadaceae bacterium]|nr:hypothetical protein [Gemmatimonadaceae bacterium]
MLHGMLLALLALLQGSSPVGRYELTFQPRYEVMSAALVIVKRDSGYTAKLTMAQLHGTVASDSVSLMPDGRVRVFVPNEVADVTFEFGVDHPREDTFLVHLLDGDLHGPLGVKRLPESR